MLIALTIGNVVLIDRLALRFEAGLVVLTGETGAGKSILLDSLGLALGARAEAGLVRRGCAAATVTAEFQLADRHPALVLAAEHGLEIDGGSLVLRRQVSADGRSRAFVNDQPVGVALLKTIGAELVEVHGQFDTQGLLDPRTHRGLLDAHAGLTNRAAQVAATYRAWQQVETAYGGALAEAKRARAEEDYLRHAVAELDALDAQTGEEDRLADQRMALMHREKVAEAITAADAALGGDQGADSSLATALRQLTRIADKAGGRLDGAIAALDRAAAETADAMALLASATQDIELDAGTLEQLEERLFALRAAARKHGVAVDRLPDLRAELARRLGLIEDQGETLARLSRQVAQARDAYLAAAQALRTARRAAAGPLDAALAQELPPLKLDKARFETAVDALDEAEWGPHGIDRVTFRVATNPGAAPGPLNKIASGGELARFMLAFKMVLSRAGTVTTLVFDEVDAGIGGAVAAAVGERLERLGREVQVLVVTHSPQVAARGVSHWQVRKSVLGDSMVTDVIELTAEARREEIARMLSGAQITQAARAAAQALMGR